MNQKYEKFIHFEICLERLASAWKTLKMIKEDLHHPLTGPAFRFALIEYATPYNRSAGEIMRTHRLDELYIPKEFLELHHRILTSRNQIQAHADLTVLEAKISISNFREERLVTRVQNNINGLEELVNIDKIIRLIDLTMDNMQNDRNRLKLALDVDIPQS